MLTSRNLDQSCLDDCGQEKPKTIKGFETEFTKFVEDYLLNTQRISGGILQKATSCGDK